MLTLSDIVRDPALATCALSDAGGAELVPLQPSDEAELRQFFRALSPRTRECFLVSDPAHEAMQRCEAIGRYDKLRLIVRANGVLVALSEFSFDLTAGDHERYAACGDPLRDGADCRWGICVGDAQQGRGLAPALAMASFGIARRFGRSRVLLWGGVFDGNERARRFYRRIGFREVGRFLNDEGRASYDMIRTLSPNAERDGA